MTPGMEGSNFPAWNEKMLKLLAEGEMKFPISEFSWEDYGVAFAGMYKGYYLLMNSQAFNSSFEEKILVKL